MSSVHSRLTCDDCVKQSGVRVPFEETCMGILIPLKCNLCGRLTNPSRLHQPYEGQFAEIQQALASRK